MITVTLYTRPGCHLCEQAEEELNSLQEQFPHRLVLIDIETDPAIEKAYALEIPVIEAGPYRLKAPFTRQELQMTLGAARDRKAHLEKINDRAYRSSVAQSQEFTFGDRLSYWITRHYLAIFIVFLLLYVGTPFLAPVFRRAGWEEPANLVYKLYKPLCHQWGFRSWFLFGEQAYYPHAAAQIPDVLTFEEVSNITDYNDPSRMDARWYQGDEFVGYKVALCERDVAIWGAMLLFGLLYAATGRRLPQIPWWLWIVAGLFPVGLDGFSQLLSQIPIDFIQSIFPYRESTPLLRTLTGISFGWMTAWFGFPMVEETMQDSRRILAKKFAALRKD
ncbi:MAG: glutaredoxin family protein [Chloroflexota bacterium]